MHRRLVWLVCVYCVAHFLGASLTSVSPTWAALTSQDHPRLQALAQVMPAVMQHEPAPSTVEKYSRSFDRFQDWCLSVEVTALPASAEHVTLYLVELLLAAESSSPVDSAVAAINWAHRHVSHHPLSMFWSSKLFVAVNGY